MRVLVVGSFRREGPVQDMFREACRDLGKALAEAGAEIVLGSTSEGTADRWVLEGAAQVEGRTPRIWIYRPTARKGVVSAELLRQFGQLDLQVKSAAGNWTASRVPQILGSDVVVLIGGGHGTEAAGHMAPALGIPVLAIASFGGAAGRLWASFLPYYEQLGELGDEVGRHFHASPAVDEPRDDPWSEESAGVAVRAAKALARSRMFRAPSRWPLMLMLLGQVALLVGWMWLFDGGVQSSTFTLFGLMAIAAFLGTSLRNNLKLVFDPTARLSWDRLLADLNAGLMLGFGLSLMYLLGGIAITGSPEAVLPGMSNTELGSDADFQRVAVVMTVLGLTGGLMIEQAADALRRWLTDRLAGDT